MCLALTYCLSWIFITKSVEHHFWPNDKEHHTFIQNQPKPGLYMLEGFHTNILIAEFIELLTFAGLIDLSRNKSQSVFRHVPEVGLSEE